MDMGASRRRIPSPRLSFFGWALRRPLKAADGSLHKGLCMGPDRAKSTREEGHTRLTK